MAHSTIPTLGFDIGDRYTHFCLLPVDGGDPLAEGRVRTTPAQFGAFLVSQPRSRVILEVGTHSPWMCRLAQEADHEVYVANPRELSFISKNDRKSDETDAMRLARVGRYDPELLRPIRHRGEEAQRDRLVLRTRDTLVAARTKMVNAIRGLVKSLGMRVKKCSTASFAKAARESLAGEFAVLLAPVLDTIEDVTRRVRGMDREIEELAGRKYPETKALRQVRGVGALTALAFVLTLEQPEHFQRSRDVGPFLGLVPRRDQSGESDRQLRITKAGDGFLRRLLVQSSQYILGPFGEDSDLRRRGLALAERGGKAGKRRAVVATARKLAVLLHALWRSGEEYEPLRCSGAAA
ncbi:MAG: IS110 family RNA-guided transposase [Planctomycetota bacterium]|jgi:transposase